MDDMLVHVAQMPRDHPSGLPLQDLGYVRVKRTWIRRAFETFNFSFILRGSGTYRWNNNEWPVVAPCIITQWPGEYVEYGPSCMREGWEELFLIYDAHLLKRLLQYRFADRQRRCWKIESASGVGGVLSSLTMLLSQGRESGLADRLDRLCELLILESLIERQTPRKGSPEAVVARIRLFLEEHFREPHDFVNLAARHGWSHSTFRRHWQCFMQVPPGHFVQKLRIMEARRLLVETDLSIAEIAHLAGFNDPLYFSRVFSKEVGYPATAYRRRHRYSLTQPLFSEEGGTRLGPPGRVARMECVPERQGDQAPDGRECGGRGAPWGRESQRRTTLT